MVTARPRADRTSTPDEAAPQPRRPSVHLRCWNTRPSPSRRRARRQPRSDPRANPPPRGPRPRPASGSAPRPAPRPAQRRPERRRRRPAVPPRPMPPRSLHHPGSLVGQEPDLDRDHAIVGRSRRHPASIVDPSRLQSRRLHPSADFAHEDSAASTYLPSRLRLALRRRPCMVPASAIRSPANDHLHCLPVGGRDALGRASTSAPDGSPRPQKTRRHRLGRDRPSSSLVGVSGRGVLRLGARVPRARVLAWLLLQPAPRGPLPDSTRPASRPRPDRRGRVAKVSRSRPGSCPGRSNRVPRRGSVRGVWGLGRCWVGNQKRTSWHEPCSGWRRAVGVRC